MNGTTEEIKDGLPGGLGERIAYLRRSQDMTQAQLAEKLGISAQAVSKWEGGLSCPDIMMLMPLAQIFGVSTDALLSGEGMPVNLKKEEPGERPSLEKEPQGFSSEDEEEEDEEDEEDLGDEEEDEIWRTGEQSFTPVEKIDNLRVDLGATQVFIRTGDTFSVKFVGYRPEETKSQVRDGQWRIGDSWKPILFAGIHNLFMERRVIITVPRGHKFHEIRLDMGAGTLTGEGLISERCRLDVGAGQMTLVDFHSGEAKIDCGMGEIKLSGSLTGRCKLECGMGSIRADLAAIEDVGYDLSCGIGEIEFGSNSFSGFGGHQKWKPDAGNFFRINCGMGSVKIHFKESK